MLKEVRRFEWEDFLDTVKAHYRKLGYDVEVSPRPGGEGFRTFRLTGKDGGTERVLDNLGAYRELADALFPGQAIAVLSVYRPKEPFLGSNVIYVAVEPSGGKAAEEGGTTPPSSSET